ncbi:hypothetical protein [Anabaenopsis arnoldii]|uniref:Uncharacterized protein n=1 Tax=Anabaenopsis arnoldii TaxID=2152938 RepID=A0ABT5ARI3_9CYAN|nr:hypothetical protein [Anabaenopsis arnoldii]MDB9539537.1 hypothetical protein [Anabaenopsis arnoldii]MDH6091843.1 hypothetical protein [Anabaenopsis arnoldii]
MSSNTLNHRNLFPERSRRNRRDRSFDYPHCGFDYAHCGFDYAHCGFDYAQPPESVS